MTQSITKPLGNSWASC